MAGKSVGVTSEAAELPIGVTAKHPREWLQVTENGSKQFITFQEVKNDVKNLAVKPGDVWIITFPKSGTTWMQETVWLLTHNLDYEGAKTILKFRSPTLESCWSNKTFGLPTTSFQEFETNAASSCGRRVIKTHLRLGLLPEKLQDPNIAKIIYVARNPKDVCVSYYYFHALYDSFRMRNLKLDEFAQMFLSDELAGTPYWAHVKEFWALRNKPNVLFVLYEDMKKNLAKVVCDLAEFLEVPVPTGDQLAKLLDHLSFESMKKNPALNRESGPGTLRNDAASDDNRFIRKGVVGDWKQKMTAERAKEFDEWTKENLKDVDLKFVDSL